MGLKQIQAVLCGFWGGDRDAALSAWASSTDKERAEARPDSDVRRVVTDVVHLHHDTPKERLWMEFYLHVPIYIERQIDKYRMTLQYQQFEDDEAPSFLQRVYDFALGLARRTPLKSWYVRTFGCWGVTQNELSGRYRTIPDRPYIMPRDVAEIIAKTQPFGSIGFQPTPESASEAYEELLRQQHRWYENQLRSLKSAQDQGRITNTEYKRARDVLRGVFGMAYMTDMRLVMNMNAFEHMMNQRLPREAQMEGRVAAYWVFKALERSGAAKVMLEEMVKANKWAPLLAEIEAAIAADNA